MTLLRLGFGIVLIAHLNARVETGPGSIEYRFEGASSVLRGLAVVERECTWPEVNGKLQAADCDVVISVEAVYKGPARTPKIVLRLPQLDPMMGLPVTAGGEYLFFLRPSPTDYLLPIETSGAIVSLEGLRLSSESHPGVRGLATDLLQAMGDAGQLVDALGLLAQFEHLSPMELQRIDGVAAPTLDSSLLKFAVLARSEPTRYLPGLVTALEMWTAANPLPDPALPTVVPPGVATIGDTLARLTTTSDLPSLARCAKSDHSYVRFCAMEGIRRLRDPATVPFLIAQLDSADSSVRYLAVITLAEITGKSGDFGPGMGLFDRDEKK
jgi:hypothetical protein